MRILILGLILFTSEHLFGQQILTADAGRDSVLCVLIPEDSIEIGGKPSVYGGSGNYTYSWDIFPKPYNWLGFKNWASDMLSDTTIANPTLKPNLPENSDGPIYFILTAMDDSGEVARDTSRFFWSTWVYGLGNIVKETFPGDTQTISPGVYSGGFPPYTYDWGDSDSLLGGQFDYNVNPLVDHPTRQVIIPAGPAIKWYGLLVTDSLGCSTGVGAWEGFQIITVSIDPIQNQHLETIVFPNPSNQYLILRYPELDFKSLQILNIKGEILKPKAIEYQGTDQLSVNVENISAGLYFLLIEFDEGSIFKEIQIIRQ